MTEYLTAAQARDPTPGTQVNRRHCSMPLEPGAEVEQREVDPWNIASQSVILTELTSFRSQKIQMIRWEQQRESLADLQLPLAHTQCHHSENVAEPGATSH